MLIDFTYSYLIKLGKSSQQWWWLWWRRLGWLVLAVNGKYVEMNCQRLSWLHWRSFWVIMPWALTAVTSRINIETSMYINDNRENWCQITIRISWKWLTKLYTTQCLFLSWTYFDKLISFFVQNKNCINNCVQEKLGIGSRQENVID